MTTRRRHGEDGISFEHRGPCRDPHRHRNCPGLWRGEFTTGYTGDGKRTRRKVRIPIESDHLFRSNPIADSGLSDHLAGAGVS